MSKAVRTRFSPSPTGRIHLGNIRTALFSALFARKHHGHFVLRIEDTDRERSSESFTDALQEDLLWLNLAWQEGPSVGGEYAPYWQSQRSSWYDRYYDELQSQALMYPCFCTDQELNVSRKVQLSRGQAPRYAGTCRHLSDAAIKERLDKGDKPAWRFKVPLNSVIEFVDLVKDVQRFQTKDIGDYIIRRADGSAPFLFCNAIDDAVMNISHVIRGEDHVANTPRQIMLLKALSLPIPQYAHLSMITGDDGAPLSKRHGSYSVHELRDAGYLPIAILNYLGRLGHHLDSQELLSYDEVAGRFHLERLSRSPARFDLSQLLHWQKLAIHSMDNLMLADWLGAGVFAQVPSHSRELFLSVIRDNIIYPHDALHWAKVFFHQNIVHSTNTDSERKAFFEKLQILKNAGEQYFVEAELAVDKYGIEWSLIVEEMKKTLQLTGKKLFMPMRIALTGEMHGPELQSILNLLGKEKVKHRLGEAIRHISSPEWINDTDHL